MWLQTQVSPNRWGRCSDCRGVFGQSQKAVLFFCLPGSTCALDFHWHPLRRCALVQKGFYLECAGVWGPLKLPVFSCLQFLSEPLGCRSKLL